MFTAEASDLVSLSVTQNETQPDFSTTTLLWRLSGSQGGQWREARVGYASLSRHTIQFTGKKGPGRGDIALDDISFINSGACGLKPDVASPDLTTTTQELTTTSTKSTTTYSFVSQSDVDCDFNSGFCGWTDDPSSEQSWSITNNSLSNNYGWFILI
jgi:hypothetical protein